MSHEKSISVEVNGKFVNLKTVIAGKTVSRGAAVKLFKSGDLKPLGGRIFSSMEGAVAAAKERSESFRKGFSRR